MNKNRSRSRSKDKPQDEDRKRRIRLAKARLMKFDNSDEEFYNRPLAMEEQPKSKLDTHMIEGDQFTEVQKQRIREREERKIQEKCREVSKQILLDSDGLENIEEEESIIIKR